MEQLKWVEQARPSTCTLWAFMICYMVMMQIIIVSLALQGRLGPAHAIAVLPAISPWSQVDPFVKERTRLASLEL